MILTYWRDGCATRIGIDNAKHDPATVLEFVRARMHPGVAVIPDVPEPVAIVKPEKRRKRK